MKTIRIGTRDSKLALAQTQLVIDEILKRHSEIEIKIITKQTKGDRCQDYPQKSFDEQGIYTDELEEALCKGEIDFAIHSAKDMPLNTKEGCMLLGCLKREDARDVMVTLKEMQYRKQDSFVIGTRGLRRKMQLRNFYPNASVKEIAGNATSRMKNLEKGEYDAVVLSAAGLKRLGLFSKDEYNYQYFSCDAFVPAGGQGTIVIESKKQGEWNSIMKEIIHEKSFLCLEAEREVLRFLEDGCYESIGVYALIIGTTMSLRMMCDNNGRVNISSVTGNSYEGRELARKLVIG